MALPVAIPECFTLLKRWSKAQFEGNNYLYYFNSGNNIRIIGTMK